MHPQHTSIKNFNFIGIHSDLTGTLNLYGKTYFYGSHKGDINQVDQETLFIFEEAVIEGNVSGKKIEVHGKVFGNINAEEKLVIYPCAEIEGSINCENLEILPGGKVSGEILSTRSLDNLSL